MQSYRISGAKIVTKSEIIEGELVVEYGKIVSFGEINTRFKYLPKVNYHASDIIMPGFIDIHIHGSNGCDVMDAEIEALKVISSSLYRQGVTSFLATTMTQTEEAIENALSNVADFGYQYSHEHHFANVLGVHLEGPFISALKIGAQNPVYLQQASLEKLNHWQNLSRNAIRKVTLAPEVEGANNIIDWCNTHGVIASIGHTNCSVACALDAIDKGVTQATHLFNAMSGVDHRQPGAATAILMSNKVIAELIVDGVHLAPEIVKMTFCIKEAEGIILVTDAMSAQGYGEGIFELGGQKVIVKNGEARLENGVLAGSVLTMNIALKNMLKFSACSLQELVKMSSFNAAKSLNFDKRKGDIQVGMDADLVVLDKSFQVKQVFRA
ncbi:N-acetylglucosamine-6-phosphate deacetylase [Fastidiosibacter lacustris]|uniref:N-acetylglucosamine-6-phosphate deacetylase n=1 Tax=Fastidiosibacter lacustris TaxID=2056695 RepID=UPI000E34CC7F|nr:N-acetylglucosamine-6-phosphate deacetylase [Fastidiosibacter lacustris]